jgi:hypothetical protein
VPVPLNPNDSTVGTAEAPLVARTKATAVAANSLAGDFISISILLVLIRGIARSA